MYNINKMSNPVICYECKYCKSFNTKENMSSGVMCKKCRLTRVSKDKQKIVQQTYYQKNKEKKVLYQREYRKKQKLLRDSKKRKAVIHGQSCKSIDDYIEQCHNLSKKSSSLINSP